MKSEIQKMIDENIIKANQSPDTSPLLAIPKKDGNVRLYLDAREINKMIVNDRTSPRELEEIMKRFYRLSLLTYEMQHVDPGR